MSHYINHSKFYDQPILLSRDEIEDPYRVLDRFFGDYRLSEVRHILSEIKETCLTTDNTCYSEPAERANLITFCNRIERVLEAVQLIMKLKGRGQRR
jgi:hypothetical protein